MLLPPVVTDRLPSMLPRIDRYILTTIARPLAAVAGVLVLVFASFDTARTLADFQDAQLDGTTVARLVGLKTLIALDVLIPLALYLATIMGLAGLYQNHEMIALRSLGIGPLRSAFGIVVVALAVAIAVGMISLHGRPWAYSQVHALESRLEAGFGIDDLAADQFHNQGDGRVVYARHRHADDSGLEGFLLYERGTERSKLTLARRAREPRERTLVLTDARVYSLNRRGPTDRIQQIDELTLDLGPSDNAGDKGPKAMSTARLWHSQDPTEIAERQWRLGRPLVAVLLAFAAIPLSASAPRSGPYARLIGAFVLFAIYFTIADMARSWVEQGLVPPLPGLWWPHALLGIALALAAMPWLRH